MLSKKIPHHLDTHVVSPLHISRELQNTFCTTFKKSTNAREKTKDLDKIKEEMPCFSPFWKMFSLPKRKTLGPNTTRTTNVNKKWKMKFQIDMYAMSKWIKISFLLFDYSEIREKKTRTPINYFLWRDYTKTHYWIPGRINPEATHARHVTRLRLVSGWRLINVLQSTHIFIQFLKLVNINCNSITKERH